jgi:hypothetical protein
MSVQTRLGAALDRIAAGTGALRAREIDTRRAVRNGVETHEERLEAVVVKLEAVADDIWRGLELNDKPDLRRAA